MHVASVALALISAGAAPGVVLLLTWPSPWAALGLAAGFAVALRMRDRRWPGEHVAVLFHIGQIGLAMPLIVMGIMSLSGRPEGRPYADPSIAGIVALGAGLMFGGAPHVLRYAGYVPFFSGAGTWRAFLPYGLALSAVAALACWGWTLAGGRLTLLGAVFGLLQWFLAWRLSRRWRRAGVDERHE